MVQKEGGGIQSGSSELKLLVDSLKLIEGQCSLNSDQISGLKTGNRAFSEHTTNHTLKQISSRGTKPGATLDRGRSVSTAPLKYGYSKGLQRSSPNKSAAAVRCCDVNVDQNL